MSKSDFPVNHIKSSVFSCVFSRAVAFFPFRMSRSRIFVFAEVLSRTTISRPWLPKHFGKSTSQTLSCLLESTLLWGREAVPQYTASHPEYFQLQHIAETARHEGSMVGKSTGYQLVYPVPQYSQYMFHCICIYYIYNYIYIYRKAWPVKGRVVLACVMNSCLYIFLCSQYVSSS